MAKADLTGLAINGGIFLALAGGAYFAYTNNLFGIRNLIGGGLDMLGG